MNETNGDNINHSVMRDPVAAADGVRYDREFIELWIAGHEDHLTSPVTRKPMGPTLTPGPIWARASTKAAGWMPS